MLTFYIIFVIKNIKFLIFASSHNGFFCPILPFVGTMYLPLIAGYQGNVVEAIGYLGKKFGFPFNLWHGHNYHYFTNDPMEAKAILHSPSAQNKGSIYRDISYVFRNSLLTLPYQLWRIRRKHFAKGFKPQSLKTFSGIYYYGSQKLVKYIKTHKNQDISYDFFSKYAFLNFFYTSTGLDKEPPGIHRLGECLIESQSHLAQKLLDPFTPPGIWLRLYPGGKKLAKNLKEIRTINQKIIDDKFLQRPDFKTFVKNEDAPSLLDLMVSVKGELLDDEDICDEMVLFSAAAADTSGHTLMIGFTLLGMYPDIQQKVYEEVMKTVGHNDITSDDLSALVYTQAVVHETLRLFPIIPIISRILDKDVDIGTKIIPKGANVAVSIFHLQRDEKYWPDPLKFDPTRFLPENSANIKPFSYMAFSTGPRDCLGKAQAMAMLKISYASVVRNFKITSKYKSIIELKCMSSISLKTIDELDCHFVSR